MNNDKKESFGKKFIKSVPLMILALFLAVFVFVVMNY